MLADELSRLHPVPSAPFTATLGVTRKVDGLSLVSFEGGRYSVPHQLAGQVVWARRHGDDIVIVCTGPGGLAEVARHRATGPGSPSVCDAHYPPTPPGPAARAPRARTQAEAGLLAIGDGAGLWLAEAAAAGASRVRAKMARTVQLSRLHPATEVDRRPGAGRRSWPVRRERPGRDPGPPGGRCRRDSGPRKRGPHPGPGHRPLGRARRKRGDPVTTRAPAPPPLDADLESLLRRMRLPHIRRAAPEVLATAKAQRWTPPRSCASCSQRKSRAGAAPRWPRKSTGRVPDRQDLRSLGRGPVLHPPANPDGAADPGMDRQARKPGRLRPVRYPRDLNRPHQCLQRRCCSRSVIVAYLLSTGFSSEKERGPWLTACRCGLRPGSARGRWWTLRMRRSPRSRSGWRRTVTCGRRTRSAVMRRRWLSGGRSWSSAARPGSGQGRRPGGGPGSCHGCGTAGPSSTRSWCPDEAPSAETLHARLAALISFYQWQAAVHSVPVGAGYCGDTDVPKHRALRSSFCR